MLFVAEGSECAARIDRVLCGRINRALGAHPYWRRQKQRKAGSKSGDSGCLSCFWVGFPPAPRFQLFGPRPLLRSPLCTTFYHILAVSRLLSRRNFKVVFPLLDQIQKIPQLVVTNSRTTRDCVYCLG